MSTITRALLKRHVDRQDGEEPESILERNALYREAMRRSRPQPANRAVFALASVTLGAILLGLLIAIPMTVQPPSGLNAAAPPAPETQAQAQPTATPAAPVDTPSPIPTPMLREEVRLRTRPMIDRSPDAPGQPALDADGFPPVYAAGPQQELPPVVVLPVIEPPVDTPRPTPARRKTAQTPAPPSSPLEFLSLTGVVMDAKNPSALINDQILGAGETIQGAKVLSIDSPSAVRVEYKGKEYTLYLK